jgi:two-component system, response regulator
MVNEKYVLLVEDNPDDVLLTKMAFKRAQVDNTLVVVSDGVEALNYFFGQSQDENPATSNQPAFVLLDLKLPFVDGMQVLEQMKANLKTRDIPVVILTSSLEPRDQNACSRLGVSDYLQKPNDLSFFVDISRKYKSLWLD